MKEFINVNVFLCEKYEEKNKNIENIFNKIKTDNEHRASFTIITLIGERGKTERTSGDFSLHYYLTRKNEEDKGKLCLYVASITANFCNLDNKEAATQIMETIEVNKVPFLKSGAYEVEVYFSEKQVEGGFEEIKRQSKAIMKESTLIAKCGFEVVF